MLDVRTATVANVSLGLTSAIGYAVNDNAADTQYSSRHTLAGHATVEDSFGYGSGVPSLWQQVPIIFGQPVVLEASMRVDSAIWAGTREMNPTDPTYLQMRSAQAVGNLGHTLRWGGITKVLDANGNPILGWSVSAASGIDYGVANTSAVPEPATSALMLAGLLLLRCRYEHRIRTTGCHPPMST